MFCRHFRIQIQYWQQTTIKINRGKYMIISFGGEAYVDDELHDPDDDNPDPPTPKEQVARFFQSGQNGQIPMKPLPRGAIFWLPQNPSIGAAVGSVFVRKNFFRMFEFFKEK